MPINKLMAEAESENVEIVNHPFKNLRLRGLYFDRVITLNSSIETTTIEKSCIIAEELGHHYTSAGNILDQSTVQNRKQELRARRWAYARLIPLAKIILAFHAGAKNRFEIAEFIQVTEDFLDSSIQSYQEKYELCAVYENYVVYFDPLIVVEMYDLS